MKRIRLLTTVLLATTLLFASSCSAKRVKPELQKQARGHYELGLAYMEKGRVEEALEELLRAQEINPYDAEVQNALGLVYYSKERFEKSITHYQRALEIDPLYSDANHNLGTVYMYLGRYPEAITEFEKALANDLYRNRTQTYNSRGWAHYKMREYEKSRESFLQAIDHSPLFVIPYNNIGLTYLDQENFEKASQYFEKAVKYNKDYAEARLNLGIAYLKLNRRSDAVSEFKATLRIDPYGVFGSRAQEYLRLME